MADFGDQKNIPKSIYPKNPWDVGRGAKTLCFEEPGVSIGGSGVSIRGVKIVRAVFPGTKRKRLLGY